MADDVFGALADETRRRLVLRLAEQSASVGELAAPYEMSRPAISRHLRVLRKAGLVTANREGRNQIYELTPDGLVAMERFIDDVRTTWTEALQSLKVLAERTRQRE